MELNDTPSKRSNIDKEMVGGEYKVERLKRQNVNYINNCDNWNRIIPVTVFLVMLFNACFMYQPKVDTNLLITALNRFDYRMSLTNDTFMSTL
jgi:hypothetical protein